MNRHPIFDYWGTSQKVPVILFAIVTALLLGAYLVGIIEDVRVGVGAAFACALASSAIRAGHLTGRVNELEDELRTIRETDKSGEQKSAD